MINWLKNTFGKLGKDKSATNYVVAEYHAVKKQKRKYQDPIASEFDIPLNETNDYMQIDRLHQKN
jgi:hypothetical protein